MGAAEMFWARTWILLEWQGMSDIEEGNEVGREWNRNTG